MTSVVTVAGVSVTTRDAVQDAQTVLDRLVADGVPRSLSQGSPRLWGRDAAATAAGRLGWLDPRPAAERAGADPDLTRVVLAGTPGAVTAAAAMARAAGRELTVLDSVDPYRVAGVLAGDLARTVLVIADPDGTAAEPAVLRPVFERAFAEAGHDPAGRVVVVTGRGSPLDGTARTFHADARSGDRFGALSPLATVPAELAGVETAGLLEEAAALRPELARPYPNPGLALGAALAGRAHLSVDGGGLGGWLEQLLAGATGRILPVTGAAGPDVRVTLGPRPDERAGLTVSGPLGAQFLVWEYATAVAARVLGVNPFGGPGDTAWREATSALLRGADEGAAPMVIAGEPALSEGAVDVHAPAGLLRGARTLASVFGVLLDSRPGYLAVVAFLDATGDARAALVRDLLAERFGGAVPVAFGWAPHWLHATGPLHRTREDGLFLYLTGEARRDLPVPGRPYGLRQFQLAQAFAHVRSARALGRTAVRLHLRDREEGLSAVLAALGT